MAQANSAGFGSFARAQVSRVQEVSRLVKLEQNNPGEKLHH